MNKLLPVIAFSHKIIAEKLKLDGSAVDATAGNGNDSLFLLKNLSKNSKLYIFDIQEEAIKNTREKLNIELKESKVKYKEDKIIYLNYGHECIKNYVTEKVRVLMFNLGYLPNSKSPIITRAETTLVAIRDGLDLLLPQGLISIVLYPRHEGGQEEADSVVSFVEGLNANEYNVIKYININKDKAPFLILIEKR